MGRSELAAQQRMQLEAILEEFEEALRNASEGNLPEIDLFLAGIEGETRDYLEREMRSLTRDVVRGNYVVLNPLESGGMGSVSKVRHLGLGKVMALKEIRPEALQIGDRDEVLRRFRREIEACGRLDEHPNVVSYTDTGVNDAGVPYLVMDFIDGEDLGKIVRRTGPLSIPDAAQVIHDAAVGLAHAHDHGLVHRDVKPSNVMISRYGVVKVLDFGLARIAIGDKNLTALTTGKVMGTFDYMSPELCREITPDHRGDVYSLGCTLFFALAGRAPFEDAKSQFDKMNAHIHSPPAPIPRLEEAPELRAILERMMAKRPEDRYQDLHEAAEALKPFCAGSNLRVLAPSARTRRLGDDSGASRIRIDDGAGRATDSKAGDRTEWTRFRRRKERKWLTGILVTAGVALFALLMVAGLWRREERRRDVANIVGTLPGLNGRWWFDEAPWLLPDVRQKLIESLADSDDATREQLFATIQSNARAPEAYEELERLKDHFKQRWPGEVASHLASVEAFDPEDADPYEFALSLRQTANSLISRPPESLTGAELHLRAVIHHYLQELEPAERMYKEAAERYVVEKQHELRALCFLDWGDLLQAFRQPAQAHSRYRLAYQALPPDQPLPPLFEVYAKAMEADSHRRIDNMREAESLLERAWQIAQTLPPQHPLRALVLERRGWLNLDLWRLEAAQADFQEALAIRRAGEPENHRARHFVLWDLQGMGMAEMYAGDAVAARQAFHDLLDQINEAKQGEMTKKQLLELEDRQPNLYERLADTALLTGSDTLDGMKIDPAAELEAAIEFAESLKFAKDGRRAVLIRLEYKLAVVRAMRGELVAAQERRDEAARYESEASSSASAPASGSRRAAYELTMQVAIAALEWKSENPMFQNSGRDKLLTLIKTAPSNLDRDDLFLLLYAAENLLKSKELAADEKAALAEQIRNLIPVPSADSSEPEVARRVQGVFARYLELAQAAGRE